MNRNGLWEFSKAAACSGGIITAMLSAMADLKAVAFIGTWTLANLLVLLYISQTGGPDA